MVESSSSISAVECRGLSYAYPAGPVVLEGVSLAIPVGERVGLIGPSGAGKSTLLMHFNGLLPEPLPQQSSAVWVHGIPVTHGQQWTIRQRVGFVFQNPDDQLFLTTVAEDVAYGPTNLGLSAADVAARVEEALAAVGLAGFGSRHPAQLSLGEKQRVALAGVLACRPEVLVLDEPTSNLDPRSRRRLADILTAWTGTLIVATHDLDFVLDLCGLAVLLDQGRVQEIGPPRVLLANPLLMDRHGLEIPWRLRPTSPNSTLNPSD